MGVLFMPNSNGSSKEFTVTSLVSGILGDFLDLARQEVALLKAEVIADWRKTKESGLMLWLGLVPALSGTILLAFMFVHLLHWSTMPAGADPAGLPLWACFGIVGGVLACASAPLLILGMRKLQSLDPLHGDSAQAFEENVHWLTGTVTNGNRLGGHGQEASGSERQASGSRV
jgi:Putative Actinobacterial Holin-X, holin superfamily III